MEGSLTSYLIVSAALFCLGIYAVLTRRNAIAFLMGIELILNSASLNFVAFARFVDHGLSGQMMAIFAIILAASEAAVALAIVLNIFSNFKTVDVDEVDAMRG